MFDDSMLYFTFHKVVFDKEFDEDVKASFRRFKRMIGNLVLHLTPLHHTASLASGKQDLS